jgi:hypothetical protein
MPTPTSEGIVSLDAGKLGRTMLTAAMDVFTKQTPELKAYAQGEFKKIGQAIVTIGKLAATGAISRQEAKLHLQMQTAASRTVFMTMEGLGLLEAEGAINAALDAVRTTVNAALPFKLL